MTRLVEFRPGVFARVGEFARGSDGRMWMFSANGWMPSTNEPVVPHELLSFAVTTRGEVKRLAYGWESNQ